MRTRIRFVASVLAAIGLSFALAVFSFVFRDTAMLAWSEQRQSSSFQHITSDSGYGWIGWGFQGFGWTEVEQSVTTPRDVILPSNSPSAPYWSSMTELPIPRDDFRLCPNCALTRVDGAFGWPLRMLAFRAESEWSWNPNGPQGASEPSYVLEPLIGWTTLGSISPLPKRSSYSGDSLVPGRVLWLGLIANTGFFVALFWAPVFGWRLYRWLREWRRKTVGACLNCGYDIAKQPEGSTCPECGAEVRRSDHLKTSKTH